MDVLFCFRLIGVVRIVRFYHALSAGLVQQVGDGDAMYQPAVADAEMAQGAAAEGTGNPVFVFGSQQTIDVALHTLPYFRRWSKSEAEKAGVAMRRVAGM